jgi:N-acetylglucosaminyldiphosphoundecaprenol N-acetyl-beta-D-mannosaminyltransferase
MKEPSRRMDFNTAKVLSDDLLREVYCVLGIPIDAIEMPAVLQIIETAAVNAALLVISTTNLNFLVNSQADHQFRESLLQSDLCSADGMPIVWIARLLGVPIKNRIAGSDIYDALRDRHSRAVPLRVFLFGGPEGVASAACRALNARPTGLYCAGSHFPGYGSVDAMSRDDIINKINSSDADFLVVSLGAKKGQSWLQRNHHRLLIPVRAHLGAVINYQAGTIERAPPIMRRLGLEWLWRIKEEPYLWRRYWNDGTVLLRLLLTRVLPLVIWMRYLQLQCGFHGKALVIRQVRGDESIIVGLSGAAITRHLDKVIPAFREAIATKKRIVIDFSETRAIDARFLGLLLMLRKKLKILDNGINPTFIGLSPGLKRIFRLNGLRFLLTSDEGV